MELYSVQDENESQVDSVVTPETVGNFLIQVSIILEKLLDEYGFDSEYLETQRRTKKSLPHNPRLYVDIFSLLYKKEVISMGELSRAVSKPKSTITRLISWMEDNGYAKRVPDTLDKRKIMVSLTDVGRQRAKDHDDYIGQRLGTILTELSVEEQKEFYLGLRILTDSLEQNIDW